jgi:uncharacterized protein (TIGR00369 family)
LLGFVLKEVEPGRAVFEMEADERHHNPMGTLHGGIFCDLADAAMGYAYAATLGEGETFTTVELKINFLRAVRKANLTAEAKVVKAGSTVGYVECDVTDQASKLVAKAASTCMKLDTVIDSGLFHVFSDEGRRPYVEGLATCPIHDPLLVLGQRDPEDGPVLALGGPHPRLTFSPVR